MEKRRSFIKYSLLGLMPVPLMAESARLPVRAGRAARQTTDTFSNGRDFDMIESGAVPDGKTLNTKVIQQTINACSENGGGTVIFPPGKYLTGAIALKSGVTLHLRKGAVLLGSMDLAHYQIPDEKIRNGNLINATGQENIGIRGEGTIDGQGAVFQRPTAENHISHRPQNINFSHCRNVTVEGIFLTNAGSWMQHYFNCQNLRITGIRVHNHCNYNNDGMDIDGCRDVIISDCKVDSDDDGICIKSTQKYICENVLVSNCLARSFCNAIKLGTKSVGGFRNIVISNCTVTPCEKQKRYYGYELGESAISVEMVDGGILDQVTISNITISDTGCPIFVRLGNRRKYVAADQEAGMLRNVRISNIMATTTAITASSITGVAGYYAENIYLDNIFLHIDNAGDRSFTDMKVRENDAGYPTARMYGEQLPAAAFFVRHAKNIRFTNIQLRVGKNNYLPVIVLDDVKNAKIIYPDIETVNGNQLLRKVSGCKDITVIT
jgi:polygalacturonase